MVKLKRALNLFQVTVYGVGIIVGAGIYTLIGIAANTAGNAVWMSFLFAAIIAMLTGLSYAELSSMFPRDSAEYEYTKHFFGKKLALMVGLMIFTSGIVSSATVALGFGGYLKALFGIPTVAVAALLLFVCGWVNYRGIEESARLNVFFTLIEAFGLVVIIAFGIKNIGSVNYLEMPNGLLGVIKASALIFFAYMGFEALVTLTEETKKATKTIAKAIILSVIITSILYVLVALVAVSSLPWQVLGGSSAPMADVGAASIGNFAFILLGIIALFSTANTVLIQCITSSRLVYGMAEDKALPKILREVSQTRKTPVMAILLVAVLTIFFALLRNIELVANITTLFLFLTFAMINATVVILRYKEPKVKRPFRIPVNIRNFQVLSFLGIIFSLIMLYFSFTNILGAVS